MKLDDATVGAVDRQLVAVIGRRVVIVERYRRMMYSRVDSVDSLSGFPGTIGDL
jgi:hypothetical protein